MKSSFITAILTLALTSTIFGCSSNINDFAVFRGNLERTGVYDVDSKMPLGEIKWKYNTETDYLSSPIISQGVVYVTGAGGYLFAINSGTGEKNWIFQGEKWGGSSPSLSKSTAYFGSMDNSVYAVDINNGQERWRFTTGDYVFSSPAVSNGCIYFGSYDGYFYALNANTGQEKWRFKTQGAETQTKPAGDYDIIGAVRSSAAIFKNIVYFGSYDGYLYALDANTGQEKWNFKTDDVIFNSTPAVANGVIYFGNEGGNLYAVDNNGREKWNFNAINFIAIPPQAKQIWVNWVSSPTIANGIAYFSVSYQWREHQYDDGSDNHLNYLFAIDMATGQLRWKIMTVGGVPTLSSNIVYFGDDDGYVFALDAETGQEKWKFKADSAIVSEIIVIDGIAYFSSKDGYLYALQ